MLRTRKNARLTSQVVLSYTLQCHSQIVNSWPPGHLLLRWAQVAGSLAVLPCQLHVRSAVPESEQAHTGLTTRQAPASMHCFAGRPVCVTCLHACDIADRSTEVRTVQSMAKSLSSRNTIVIMQLNSEGAHRFACTHVAPALIVSLRSPRCRSPAQRCEHQAWGRFAGTFRPAVADSALLKVLFPQR